jgi:hypothetical protein
MFPLVVRAYIYALIFLIIPIFSYSSDDFLSPITSTHEKIEQLLSTSTISQNIISICYNYSCKTQYNVSISQDDIQRIKSLFAQSLVGNIGEEKERYTIAKAIAVLEKITARQTPTYNDKAKNYNDNGLPGRMDCIDSTVNTTDYLQFINNLGLLQYHQLQKPIYRSPFIMGQHWAAQIRDKTNGQYYAVDSWQTDNGQPPVIQNIESWKVREAIETH